MNLTWEQRPESRWKITVLLKGGIDLIAYHDSETGLPNSRAVFEFFSTKTEEHINAFYVEKVRYEP